MATVLPLDVQTKVAAEVSEAFADAYYTALQAARHTLSSFYVLHEATADGKTVPAIAWNGNLYESGAQFQEAFVELMPEYSYFEVQSLDAQVLNPVPPAPRVDDVEDAMVDGADGGKKGTPAAKKKEAEELVGSVLVLVNGFVRLKEKKEGPQKGFSETFVLVPNKEWSRKDGGRRWVVQNQNFRYVV